MEFVVAIPSYKRSKACNAKTLRTLNIMGIDRALIHIFIVAEEYDDYIRDCNPDWYGHLIIGHKGVVQQRQFISDYFSEGQHIVSIDDDVSRITLDYTPFLTLTEFFQTALQTCREENAFIWGVYPIRMPIPFGENISTDLRFIIGTFYGYINRKNQPDLQLKLTTNKEDHERSILYWLKDKKVIRFNDVYFQSKMYANDGSGIGTLQDRIAPMKADALALKQAYPDLVVVRERKNGLYEISLTRKKCVLNLYK